MTDQELLKNFNTFTLKLEHWNNRNHLRVAFLYCTNNNLEEALSLMKIGIQNFNAHHNVPNLKYRGYNETITFAWIHIIFNILQNQNLGFHSSNCFLKSHPHLLKKDYLLNFYTQEEIFSKNAKERFLLPNKIENDVTLLK